MVEDITKLPKWAQRRIQTLERDNADLVAQLTAGDADTDVHILDYVHGDRPLPRHTVIKFTLSNGGYVQCRVNDKRDCVNVMTEEALHVQPEVTNVINVWTARWR